MSATPNMGLVLPDDHGSIDVWDTILDVVFAQLDAHDHTAGNGALVPVAGLIINAHVQMASGGSHFALYDALAYDFFPSAPSSATSFAGALFMSSADNELYWRTAGGTNVKITNGAALNVASFIGGIGGDYSAVGALESYDDASRRYLFQQEGSPRPWAGLAAGNVDIYEQAASIVNRVRLQSHAALAASYALTFPAALPASVATLRVDATGNLLDTPQTFTLIVPAMMATPTPGGASVAAPGGFRIDASDALPIEYPIQLDAGCTITAWKLWCRKNTNASHTIQAQLQKMISSTDTGPTGIGAAQANAANAPGAIALALAGLAQICIVNEQYSVVFTAGGTAGDSTYSLEVTYTRP